jgi:hypothetical protein
LADPPPFQSLSGHCVCAAVRHKRLEQPGLRSHDADLAFSNLDALGERAKMVTAVAAAFKPGYLSRSGTQPALVIALSERHAPRAQDVVGGDGVEMEVG